MPYQNLKNIFVKLPFIKSVAYYLTRHIPRVLMYHRFVNNGLVKGVSRETFEWQLNLIKKDFHVMSLSQYIDKINSGISLSNVVIITIDDAYEDFYSICYPLLKKYEMPATLFVPTDFIGNRAWFWWDKIKYIMEKSLKDNIKVLYNNKKFTINSSTDYKRYKSWNGICDFCLTLSDREKDAFINTVAISMDVDIPSFPIGHYRQMTWEQIAEVSKNNVEIGSHAKSHPVLTKLNHEDIVKEAEDSKRKIVEKTGIAVKTFCYPHGMPSDYNSNVAAVVRNAGYIGAVVAHDGAYDQRERYIIKRIGAPNDSTLFLWKLYGFEMLKCYGLS